MKTATCPPTCLLPYGCNRRGAAYCREYAEPEAADTARGPQIGAECAGCSFPDQPPPPECCHDANGDHE